jgi:predicted O-methyltransferase YrrM
MNNILAEILQTGQTRSDSGELVKIHSAVTADIGAWLQEMVRAVTPAPATSLEVGLAYGISTLFLCDVLAELKACRHIVIDPYQIRNADGAASPWSGCGLANIRRAGFDRLVDFRESPSYAVIPELIRSGERVDFAFIDGWTTFDAKLVDFFLVDRILRVGGIVAIRAGLMPSGLAVCRYIAANRADHEIAGTFPLNRGYGGVGQELTAFRKLCEDYRSWTDHAAF